CCTRLFFFQAEDGIRDRNVTGVQTCALPIYLIFFNIQIKVVFGFGAFLFLFYTFMYFIVIIRNRINIIHCYRNYICIFDFSKFRSEERRVGKEYISVGSSGRSKEEEVVESEK